MKFMSATLYVKQGLQEKLFGKTGACASYETYASDRYFKVFAKWHRYDILSHVPGNPSAIIGPYIRKHGKKAGSIKRNRF